MRPNRRIFLRACSNPVLLRVALRAVMLVSSFMMSRCESIATPGDYERKNTREKSGGHHSESHPYLEITLEVTMD